MCIMFRNPNRIQDCCKQSWETKLNWVAGAKIETVSISIPASDRAGEISSTVSSANAWNWGGRAFTKHAI